MIFKTVGIFQMNPRFKPAVRGGIKEVLKKAGQVFANEAKQHTIDEDHIVTARYMLSIGNPLSEFGIFEFGPSNKWLDVGSSATDPDTNEHYAPILERRYHILAISLDKSEPKIKALAGAVFAKSVTQNS